jgi:hypothetical protein
MTSAPRHVLTSNLSMAMSNKSRYAQDFAEAEIQRGIVAVWLAISVATPSSILFRANMYLPDQYSPARELHVPIETSNMY